MDVTIKDQPELQGRRACGTSGPYRNASPQAFERPGSVMSNAAGHIGPRPRGLLGALLTTIPEADRRRTRLRSDAAIVAARERRRSARGGRSSSGAMPAGRYAHVVHKGGYEGLPGAWTALKKEWLPNSGHRMGGPSYELYLNDPMSYAEGGVADRNLHAAAVTAHRIDTCTGLPLNVTRRDVLLPATRTSMSRTSGARILDPGDSESVSRRSRRSTSSRSASSRPAVREGLAVVFIQLECAVGARDRPSTVSGPSTGSSVYCFTGPIGMIAPARTYSGIVARSTARSISRPPSMRSSVQKSNQRAARQIETAATSRPFRRPAPRGCRGPRETDRRARPPADRRDGAATARA